MAGFVIAAVAGVAPFALGRFGLGRPFVIGAVGGVVGFGWLVTLAAKPPGETSGLPLWYLCGMVALLFAIWCAGLWLGVRMRRMRHVKPG